ncbi:hypothetical protein VPH35_039991 [Triticum aestivum]
MGNLPCSSVKKRYGKDGSPPAETRSRCWTESATMTHNFEVTDFSLLEGAGAGSFAASSAFTVGGYEWELKLYPDGWKAEDKSAWVSIFLSLRKGEVGASGVKTRFTFSLLDQHGRASKLVSVDRSATSTFKSTGNYCGFDKFVDKSKLRRLLDLSKDSFTIKCVLTPLSSRSRSRACTNFLDMLKGGEGADVTFTVGSQSFLAHRRVLAARSPVFKAELFGKMNETLAQSVKIDGMEPSIFEALLHFIYTDSLPDDRHADDRHTEMQHLLVAADQYGVDRLMAICEEKLCQSINVKTVATTLALAEQHHCVHLKRACLEFLSSGDVRQAVKETDGFRYLVASCPSVILEIFDKPPPLS